MEIDSRVNLILSRREVSTRLGISERTLRDNQILRALELRVGKQVYYDWTEIVKVIKSLNSKKEK